MILSKNVNNKKCAPKLVFFNEKKKIQIIFVQVQQTQLKMSDEGEIWKRIVIVVFLKKNKLYLRYTFTISHNFFDVTQYFFLSGFKSFVEISSRRLSRKMDSTV